MESISEKKTDRRLLRTKRQIRDALLELSGEKQIEKITIKELAERADIDRKTFYLHYDSISGVLEEIHNELLEKLTGIISEHDLFQPDFDALGFFRSVNTLIGEGTDFYRQMVQADKYSFFHEKLKVSMKEYLRKKYHQKLAQSPISIQKLNLYAEYTASGVMAIYVEWLKHPELDLELVAQAATEIAYGGGRAVLEKI